MRTSLSGGGLAAVLAVAVLLSCGLGNAQAHPLFVGRWTAVSQPAAPIVYEFGPAEYVNDGVWRGSFTLYISNIQITCGTYELRIMTGSEGTVGLREAPGISTTVGNIDLGTRVMTYKDVTFRH
jgi:hypothetical protein